MDIRLKFVAALAIASSILGVVSLLPMAFGIAGMGPPQFPLAIALTFVVFLGGPLLLLVASLGLIFPRAPRTSVLAAFFILLVVAGFLLFWRLPGHGFIVDWMVMSIVLVLIAAALGLPWRWAFIGGIWQGMLLGLAVAWSVRDFLSPTPGPFPTQARVWFLGCLFALGTTALAFAWRNRKTEIETSGQSK